MANKANKKVSAIDLQLRCYAERDGDQWVAICIDLNLAAQSDTLDDAKQRLHAQIVSYVHDAVAGPDQAHAAELMFHRKAPFAVVARYHALNVLHHLHAAKRKFRTFSDVLPLAPSMPRYA